MYEPFSHISIGFLGPVYLYAYITELCCPYRELLNFAELLSLAVCVAQLLSFAVCIAEMLSFPSCIATEIWCLYS